MISSLFVYGTLAPAKENERFLKGLAGRWQKAFVTGFIYPKGLPATRGYPALRLASGGNKIAGLLFTAPRLASIWQALDAFEGEGYVRTSVLVTLKNGQVKQAYIYSYDESYAQSAKP